MLRQPFAIRRDVDNLAHANPVAPAISTTAYNRASPSEVAFRNEAKDVCLRRLEGENITP
jgi:hypothetical protein